MTKSQIIKNCLKQIEEKSCLGNAVEWVQRDYEKLSDLIKKQTNISLSVSTLRRVWNTDKQFRPQKTTLDALALFVGYKDWHEYISRCIEFSEVKDQLADQNQAGKFSFFNKPFAKLIVIVCVASLSIVVAFLLLKPKKVDVISAVNTESASLFDPTSIIDSLYRSMSFTKNTKPNIEAIRPLFLKDASIILKSSETQFSSYSLEGFLESLDHFSKDEYIKMFGYKALVEQSWVYKYGDIAHIYVHYKGVLFGFDQALNMGFDSFHLIKSQKGWKISSLIGDYFDESVKLPSFLN